MGVERGQVVREGGVAARDLKSRQGGPSNITSPLLQNIRASHSHTCMKDTCKASGQPCRFPLPTQNCPTVPPPPA